MKIRRQRLAEVQSMFCSACDDKTNWGVTVTQVGEKPVITGLLCTGPQCLPDGSVTLTDKGYVLP
jgi:hypothetical protein